MINGRDLKEWIGTTENFYLLCWISKDTCVRKKRNNQLVLWQRPAQLLSAQLLLGISVLLPSLSSLNKILQHSENYYYIKKQNKPLPTISKHYHIEIFSLCRPLCSSQDFFLFVFCFLCPFLEILMPDTFGMLCISKWNCSLVYLQCTAWKGICIWSY